ncbi:hypothetical protein EGK75_02180 [Neisseria weixii]|uniref:Uncharacterized protein n=1 Tax=Neisseria weixii TaxID=1853276 RepID=A0A3N4N484_9NEIS|nr:hypothetical protein EGK74_02340 [Neisseria weixii]RPD90272.1 hypothetical protein EGK75_02180 [Neisseria weixii]
MHVFLYIFIFKIYSYIFIGRDLNFWHALCLIDSKKQNGAQENNGNLLGFFMKKANILRGNHQTGNRCDTQQ